MQSRFFSRVVPRWILRRLAHALLAAAIALGLSLGSEVRADAPQTMYKYSYGGYTGKWGSTYAAACSYMNSANPGGWGTGYTWTLMSGQTTCGMFYNGSQFIVQVGVQTGSGCADGSNPDLTKPTSSQCGPPPPNCSDASLTGKYVGAWVVGQGSSAPGYACIQGCQYPQGSIAVGLASSYGMEVGKGNGQTCSGANYDSIDTTTKASDPPSPVSCGKMGLVYGTVNGVGICAKGGEVPGTTVTKTDSTTTQTTDASGVQAPSQTTNTTTNVTNVNGVPTVTKTTTKPDGSKETSTEPKDVYCASHPNDALCKTDSQASGGDDCKTPPVCKGDAVQCAMLSQQWKIRCDNQQTNAASDLATSVLAGNDPSKNPAAVANRDVRPISNSIDQTAFLGGGGLQDKVVTVSGQSITLPFSRLNQYLEWIGRVFVVLSLIGAIRIVLGGFKK